MSDYGAAPRGNGGPGIVASKNEDVCALFVCGTAEQVGEVMCKVCPEIIETRRGGGGPGIVKGEPRGGGGPG